MSTQQNPLSLTGDDTPSALTQITGLLDAMASSMQAIRAVVETTDDAARARQALTERTADLDAMLHAFGFSPDQAFGA